MQRLDLMSTPKTLAMRKMQKNYIAVLEKRRPKQPYNVYSVFELAIRTLEEFAELAFCLFKQDVDGAQDEIADLQNILDYMYEILASKGKDACNLADEKGESTSWKV